MDYLDDDRAAHEESLTARTPTHACTQTSEQLTQLRRLPYQDLGADYLDQRRKHTKTDYLLRQLHKLGYAVQIEVLPVG